MNIVCGSWSFCLSMFSTDFPCFPALTLRGAGSVVDGATMRWMMTLWPLTFCSEYSMIWGALSGLDWQKAFSKRIAEQKIVGFIFRYDNHWGIFVQDLLLCNLRKKVVHNSQFVSRLLLVFFPRVKIPNLFKIHQDALDGMIASCEGYYHIWYGFRKTIQNIGCQEKCCKNTP